MCIYKVLITYKGQNIGVLNVESKWCPDKVRWWECVLNVTITVTGQGSVHLQGADHV